MSHPQEEQIFAALYVDDDGQFVGLDEVQLMESPPPDRIDVLHAALGCSNLEISYKAAIVLAAWGDNKGFDALEHLVDMRIDKQGVCEPHRIYGYNNVFDSIAHAVYLFGDCGRRDRDQVRLYQKILALYGECDFESKLKYALLRVDFPELANNVESACKRSRDAGKLYLASQMLPVIARWAPARAWELLPAFWIDQKATPNPTVNIAEALAYFQSREAETILHHLANHCDKVVSMEARNVIDQLY